MQGNTKLRNCTPYADAAQFEAAVHDARMADFDIPICCEESYMGMVERIEPKGVVLDTTTAVGVGRLGAVQGGDVAEPHDHAAIVAPGALPDDGH